MMDKSKGLLECIRLQVGEELLGKNMKITLITIFLVLPILIKAETLFEFWVWAEKDAEKDPLTKAITWHEACSGKITRLITNRIPINNPAFSPENVYEISTEGKKLNTWGMPIDYIVYGIEGDSIIVGHGLLQNLLKINLDDSLNKYKNLNTM